ncbi:MAG: ribosome maturation factor RimP [Clostridia bacterium]
MAERKKGVNIADYIKELAKPIAEEYGVSIWDTVFVKEGADWFLRIFIDKEGGVGIEDCVNVTKAINPILDEKDPISQEYTLEVSSCGVNRKLTKKEHFLAYLEQPVMVKLIRPLEDGRREIDGVLIDVLENGDFEVIIEENLTATFSKKECASVNIIEEIDF